MSDYYINISHGRGATHSVRIHYGLCLHFSFDSLVAIELDGTTFVSQSYINYSSTTSRHINRLHNRVVVSPEQFKEIKRVCMPEPPPQTKQWLLQRLEMGAIGTHS